MNFNWEKWKQYAYVVGVDEVGRGPLAGPVMVGAVLLDVGAVGERAVFDEAFKTIRDSKRVSPKKREEWCKVIQGFQEKRVVQCAIASVGPGTIDRVGITRATASAVARALSRFGVDTHKTLVLLDGRLSAPKQFLNQESIIGGDDAEPLIAAGSIIAKVARDAQMHTHAQKYPHYGFERHKGYGTQTHIENIQTHGICPIHRKSFLRSIVDSAND